MIACSEKARGLCFAVADGLILGNQFFMERDSLFVRHQLEHKVSGLPLKDVRPLTAQILE